MAHYSLLFNGCSFTEGSELQGKEDDFEYRNLNRYSQVVTNKTGLSHANISMGGNSNDRITRTTIDWFRENTCDLAIIQLTVLDRTEYISPYDGHPVNFCPGQIGVRTLWKTNIKKDHEETKEAYDHYYKYVYNKKLGLYNFYKNLYILEQYFEKNNIKHYFMKLDQNWPYLVDLDTSKLKLNDYNGNLLDFYWRSVCKNKFIDITSIKEIIPHTNSFYYTEDYRHEGYTFLRGTHPSILGHRKIANHILGNIKDQF
jgi:hypothetical protein